MSTTPAHLWETADGDLVPTGHPDAVFLKYAAGDEVPKDAKVRDEKQARPASNKMRKPADNKASE